MSGAEAPAEALLLQDDPDGKEMISGAKPECAGLSNANSSKRGGGVKKKKEVGEKLSMKSLPGKYTTLAGQESPRSSSSAKVKKNKVGGATGL